MRMAFLSIHSSPLGRAGEKDTGGMSTYLRGLSKALGQTGRQIDLFTRSRELEGETVRHLGPNVRLICFDDGLGPLGKEEIYPHCRRIAQNIDRFRRQESISYDLIFSHYWLSAWTGQLLKENWQVSHLVMFHTVGQAKNDYCPGENEPPLRLEKEAELARACDRVVVAAQNEKENLLKYFNLPPGKITVIPGGVDRALFKPFGEKERLEAKKQIGAFEDEKIILAAGRIEPVKGYDLLLKAAALLPAEENYRIFIIGGDRKDSLQVASLKETAVSLGLAKRVCFTSALDHARMPLFYNAASVCVLPSFYESFGLVALESLACGTPLVASPVGVVPEILTGFKTGELNPLGFLVEKRLPEFWAAAIRKVLLGPGTIASDTVESALGPYSWEKAAATLLRQVSEQTG
ncbi:MAG: glycosyltransferase [Bacillota bacterium]